MTIGQKLTALRKARGLTQEELSEAVGVTRQTISKWELDASTPDLDYLCKLCDLFGVTADYLIRAEKETVASSDTPSNPPVSDASPTNEVPASPKKPLSMHIGGILFGLGINLLPIALLVTCLNHNATVLWISGGLSTVFGLELLLIRHKPWFAAMWTAWLLWTGSQFLLTGSVIFFLFLSPDGFSPMNWNGIFTVLWLIFTVACIGVTVGVIAKRVRARR